MIMIVNFRVVVVLWVGFVVIRLWWGSIAVFNMMMFMVGWWRWRRSIVFLNNMVMRLMMGRSIMFFNMVGLMVMWWSIMFFRMVVNFMMYRVMVNWMMRHFMVMNRVMGFFMWVMQRFHNNFIRGVIKN